MVADLIESIAKIVFVFSMNVGFFAPVLGWVERKQSALMQDRIGANRADILGFTAIGLFHSLADALKVLAKEDFIPAGANKFFHTVAPFICLVPAISTFAVVPFGGRYELFGHQVNLVIADLDVGILFVFSLPWRPTEWFWPDGRQEATGPCWAACAHRPRCYHMKSPWGSRSSA